MAFSYTAIPLRVEGVNLNLSTIHNLNANPPILFLHGFGSCKEDLSDIILNPALQHYGFLAFDAPGCGHSQSDDLSAIDISFLSFHTSKSPNFILWATLWGGLTSLLLAHKHPERVLSFVNIKGNLAPEDCFLSRQIFNFPSDNPEEFLDMFIARTRETKSFASALYASTLRARVQAGAVRPIFESMVRLSDNEDLLGKFSGLPCPKMFMFGEENSGLSYLRRLEKEDVELAEISQSGHFPMYSNPVEMWRRIAAFLNRIG
ncbi:hypothetical protein N7526_002778 [Penicillium atrosanguineum]|nr:hypothetical protein N7526_002778 [Penicillium atrosanguineum]